MPAKGHNVQPNKSGGWDVKKDGAKRASKHFENKDDAIDYGRDVSKNQGTELRIKGKDNKIQQSDSHGKDPCPPKDKD